MSEIVFEVRENEADGSSAAAALGQGIHTEGRLWKNCAMTKDAVHSYFDETTESPKIIRLHYVRDEVLVECEMVGFRLGLLGFTVSQVPKA